MFQLHLISGKATKQLAAHAALVQAAAKVQRDAPPPPKLDFAYFSGRGVKLRLLDPDEKDALGAIVAKELGENGLMPEFLQRLRRAQILRCLVAVTREKELDETALAKATWVQVKEEQLEDPKHELSVKALFTSKDFTMLSTWYQQQHDITAEDVDAVLGKARELADD